MNKIFPEIGFWKKKNDGAALYRKCMLFYFLESDKTCQRALTENGGFASLSLLLILFIYFLF